jgi:hypothetical protein
MYHTTGFARSEIVDLCAMVYSAELEPGINHWPPVLGLFKSMVVALTYLRRNRAQAEIGEAFGVSQPKISRAITELTPILGNSWPRASRWLRTLTRGVTTSSTGHCCCASARSPGAVLRKAQDYEWR